MNRFSNVLSVSLRSIMKNKRRNIFTMIGIVIGIAAVITIMSLGNGFKKTAAEQFSDSGASKDSAIINFLPSGESNNKADPFSPSDIQIAERVNGVASAHKKEDKKQSFNAKMTNSQHSGDINIYKNNEYQDVEKGKGFDSDNNDIEDKVVTVDKHIAKKVFNNDAIGKTLFIEDEGFKIVGIANDAMEPNTVHMPSKTFDHYVPNLSQDFAQLEIKLEEGSNKKEVANKVAKKLSEKGTAQSSGTYQYSDTEQMMKGITKVFDGITYFVAAVAGISLFIAGIGVMNVMYISVAERSEEIAIRRAFGAKARDIEIQFLVESVVLCLIGSIIGLIIGIAIASLVDAVTPDYIKSVVSIGSVLLAVGVSTLIGVVFGWIPARAAAKKELIDIIK